MSLKCLVASKVAKPSLLFDWPCWLDQHAIPSEPSPDTLPYRAPMNSPTSSIFTPPLTTASTCPLTPYPCSSATCSPVQGVTSTSSKPQWPTPTTGVWHEKSHVTRRSMTMLLCWRSRSRNTNATSMPHRPALCHVSPTLCLPMP
jgi:hypothetical protein